VADTSIEWATKVWNVTRGCSRVSPGCGGAAGEGGCYAERQAMRFSGPGQPYEGLVRLGKQGPRWTGAMRFVPEKLTEPLSWRTPQRIFVDSMSDLFHDGVSDDDIERVFAVMAICAMHERDYGHIFQILTKRAARMRQYTSASREEMRERLCTRVAILMNDGDGWWDQIAYHMPWPLPNVHCGVSVEDQKRADERIPDLEATPAAVRFISLEPQLESVYLRPEWTRISWLVQGGE
jgi:protein gp37